MKIWDLILSSGSNLLKTKGRSLLTINAILIGTFSLALTLGVNTGVNDYISKQLNLIDSKNQATISFPENFGVSSVFSEFEIKKYDPDARVTASNEFFKYFTEDEIESISSLKSVKKIIPYISLAIDFIQSESEEKFEFSAINQGGFNLDLISGREVSSESEDYEINLAYEYINVLGFDSAQKAVGETVNLAISSQVTKDQTTVKAKIVGVRNISLLHRGESVVNQKLANEILNINEDGLPENLKENYFLLYVTVDDNYIFNNMYKFKQELETLGFMALTIQDEFKVIRQIVNAITAVLTLFGSISLLSASFGIINTLYMSVQDRTREIGLMKALGMTRFKIFMLFNIEALLIGITGGGAGVILAYIIGEVLNEYVKKHFLAGLEGFNLIQFNGIDIFIVMIIILVISFIASALPANKAAKLNPIDSLKYE